jgi:hypothetical protein
MYFAAGLWFSLIIVVLFSAVLFLRAWFPNASKRREMAVLLITTLLFFGVCYLFLPRTPMGTHMPATPEPSYRISGSQLRQ